MRRQVGFATVIRVFMIISHFFTGCSTGNLYGMFYRP